MNIQLSLFVNQPQTKDYIYLAGLLDGEGYLGLTKTHSERYKNKFTYKARVVIANCNLELLENIKHIFGGYIIKKKTPNPKWTQGYNLTIGYIDRWLPQVAPYMKAKQKKAILLLEAIELLRKRKKATNQAFNLSLKRLSVIDQLLRKKEWLL